MQSSSTSSDEINITMQWLWGVEIRRQNWHHCRNWTCEHLAKPFDQGFRPIAMYLRRINIRMNAHIEFDPLTKESKPLGTCHRLHSVPARWVHQIRLRTCAVAAWTGIRPSRRVAFVRCFYLRHLFVWYDCLLQIRTVSFALLGDGTRELTSGPSRERKLDHPGVNLYQPSSSEQSAKSRNDAQVFQIV